MKLLLIIPISIVLFAILMVVRMQIVYRFRERVSDLCYQWSMKEITTFDVRSGKKLECAYEWLFDSLPDMEVMIWKFWKPLKLESWISKEDLDKLFRRNESI